MHFLDVNFLAVAQEVAASEFVRSAWLPLLIFIARVSDVTLQTVRIIFLTGSKRYIAPVLGFFEVLIWVIVISQMVRNLSNLSGYLAYAGGFAVGTYVGILVEQKLALGTLLVRVITVRDATKLIERLRDAGYGVTSVEAYGATGPAHLIYTIIKRRNFDNVMSIIRELDPKVFVSVEAIRSASQGIFPTGERQASAAPGLRLGK